MSITLRFGRVRQLGEGSVRPAINSPTCRLKARVRAAVRRCIADEIQHLVDVLDMLDADPDLEDEPDAEDDSSAEPWLGWPNPMGERLDALANMAFGYRFGTPHDDRELDEADGRLMDAGDDG